MTREAQRPRRSSEAVTESPGSSVTDQGSARPKLLGHHRQLLIDRGLNELTIAARGYSSTVMPGWLRQVGFSIEGQQAHAGPGHPDPGRARRPGLPPVSAGHAARA